MARRGKYEEQERHIFFGNLQTQYNVPGEKLKHVAEANHISENIHYKNENTAVTFEVYVRRIEDS